MSSPYRVAPEAHPVRIKRWWWPLVRELYPYISEWQWVRRAYGGKWEQHDLSSIGIGSMWLPVFEFGDSVSPSWGVLSKEDWS